MKARTIVLVASLFGGIAMAAPPKNPEALIRQNRERIAETGSGSRSAGERPEAGSRTARSGAETAQATGARADA